MGRTLTHRRVRLRAVWLLILPFLYFAEPTAASLWVGGTLALVGLSVRTWAAGTIDKDRSLTTGGPYAHTRNPLYLGSLLLGTGLVVAGGVAWFLALFALFFAAAYGAAMRAEGRVLEERFGEGYRTYAARVPLLVPRLSAYRGGVDASFSLTRYRRNREWEALAGAAAGFALLVVKTVWFG